MSRLPPALARRVDRLARRAHAFHRFAHHPLCSWYATEVIRLGRRTRICLGCTLTALGAVAGVAVGSVVPAASAAGLLAAGIVLLAAVPLVVRSSTPARASGSARAELQRPIALSLSKGERSKGRARKLLSRLLPAAVAGFTVAQALAAPSLARAAAAVLAAAAVGWVVLRYRRRGPDRSACQACPDGPPGSRCPGLGPIARRERALSRLAGRWIAAAVPVQVPEPAPAGRPVTSPLPRPWPAAPPASPPTTPRPS